MKEWSVLSQKGVVLKMAKFIILLRIKTKREIEFLNHYRRTINYWINIKVKDKYSQIWLKIEIFWWKSNNWVFRKQMIV